MVGSRSGSPVRGAGKRSCNASPRLAPEAILIDHNAFPREVMLEAIVRAVEEAL